MAIDEEMNTEQQDCNVLADSPSSAQQSDDASFYIPSLPVSGISKAFTFAERRG